ncbi:alpha/beta hydrolase [Staphylococcus simiae]|uniref:alpha/beta fold hydrolase n=1 Tax=Staphylococcus simiae TaxID=308354 RepID=UPI001A9759D5|nr:alpha/beta hydrolase [Staphylococcus simiae]MBO1199577.1 alpha/beta hydrolase [Staphylococcus simiae]MBO1201611.1 alpha/beta hydrolase [Staphylococcus simiae]MBO1203732.1 alpha/beta hydrolase [Staphylococcus simiae]MBO1211620.1 alpha/beta hydrolase [Staphylococcus simiae]MBO1230006.1 alpha/beta hydrolase [Staphylococcus simiae]
MNKVQTNSQTQLAYKEQGEGDVIILLHGLDGNLAGFEQLQQMLSKTYKVISYDMRGHGKSTHQSSYELMDHVNDLKALMEQLKVHKAHIIGFDLGGVVAKLFTDQFACCVKSLTLIAAKQDDLIHGFTQLLIDYQDKVAGFNKSEAYIILFSKLFKNQESTMKWYQNQRLYSMQTEDDSAAAVRALIQYQADTTTINQHTCVPTLIINGKYDPLIKDKQNFPFEDYYTNVTKYVFEHSGHAPHIEESDKFLEYYLEFLNKIN